MMEIPRMDLSCADSEEMDEILDTCNGNGKITNHVLCFTTYLSKSKITK